MVESLVRSKISYAIRYNKYAGAFEETIPEEIRMELGARTGHIQIPSSEVRSKKDWKEGSNCHLRTLAA
jgi:hypothetical protein